MHFEPVQNAIDSINMTTVFFFFPPRFSNEGDVVNTLMSFVWTFTFHLQYYHCQCQRKVACQERW